MSQLDLNLIPTHPDRSGGLGEVGRVQEWFGILAVALLAGPAGVFAREIFLNGISLRSYQFTIAGLVVLSLVIFLGPMLIFSPQLILARWRGLREYGLLANTYGRKFHGRWITGEATGGAEALLGTGDIQSLADMGNSYDFVSRMRVVPFGPRTAGTIVLSSLAPMLPLAFAVVSMRDILDLLFKMLF